VYTQCPAYFTLLATPSIKQVLIVVSLFQKAAAANRLALTNELEPAGIQVSHIDKRRTGRKTYRLCAVYCRFLLYTPVFAVADHRGQDPTTGVLLGL